MSCLARAQSPAIIGTARQRRLAREHRERRVHGAAVQPHEGRQLPDGVRRFFKQREDQRAALLELLRREDRAGGSHAGCASERWRKKSTLMPYAFSVVGWPWGWMATERAGELVPRQRRQSAHVVTCWASSDAGQTNSSGCEYGLLRAVIFCISIRSSRRPRTRNVRQPARCAAWNSSIVSTLAMQMVLKRGSQRFQACV